MTEEPIVVVGGGHAGAQFCAAMAAAGQAGRIQLVCGEASLPYQRPPLSKAFLRNPSEGVQALRSEAWFADAGVTLHRGDPAVAIDRARGVVLLRSGLVLPYARLVLATGLRNRWLPHLAEGLVNVAALRTAEDALRLRAMLATAGRLTVVGGGFIGLEIAATARALGKEVEVLESAPRLLMRSVSTEVSRHVETVHRDSGIRIRLGVAVGGFETEGGRLAALAVDGARQGIDALLLGIGAAPEHALASAAGLHCDNGVVVDAYMRSSDPAILAIGDCASFPEAGSHGRVRLESVQNANDQARTAAGTLLGRAQAHAALPWFWSEQGSLRLQIAGLLPPGGARYLRAGAAVGSFSVLHYLQDRLCCVESVNAAADHIAARKLLEGGVHPEAALACDGGRALKSFLG